MLPSSYHWVDDELRNLEAQDLRRQRRIRQSPQAATIRIDDRNVLNFAANDYLGLATELARLDSSQDEGWGSGASPMICGRSNQHQQLEIELAKFEQTESALLFSSGYAANVGTITALVRKPDVVFSDELNHASIIDGCRLSGAEIIIYPHADPVALWRLLDESRSKDFRRRLIVTDTLFSMEGDAAPLPELAELAAEHDAMLLVDEAHATGVFGATGRGLVEHFQLEEFIPVRIGTLSKALGSLGGFAVGSQAVIEWIAHAARSYFFSTAPPDAIGKVTREALRIVQHEPHRRHVLLQRASQLRSRLVEIGCDCGASTSQIVPIILGDAKRAVKVSSRLLEQGIFVPAIRPPSVPAGRSLLRISLSYRHTVEDIERLVTAIAAALRD